jgi:hypothetical protein
MEISYENGIWVKIRTDRLKRARASLVVDIAWAMGYWPKRDVSCDETGDETWGYGVVALSGKLGYQTLSYSKYII